MTSFFHRSAVAAMLVCALLVGGCAATSPSARSRPAKAADASGAALIAAAQPAIAAANAAWPDALRSRNAAAMAAPFADGGTLVTAGGKAINGRAAIEAYYREAFEHAPPILDGAIADEGVAASGNLVYVWGRGTYTVEHAPGQASTNGGPFFSVWQADASGAWKLVRYLTF